MAETYDKYTRGSNPVKYFVEKGLEPDTAGKVTKVKLFEHYQKFCREFGLAPESPQSFSRKLTDDFHLHAERGRIKGELVYCWMDIRLKDWQKEEKEMEQNLQDFSDETKQEMK
jgi:phage/plasmid-associated DNA primase